MSLTVVVAAVSAASVAAVVDYGLLFKSSKFAFTAHSAHSRNIIRGTPERNGATGLSDPAAAGPRR